jgi:cytochrome c oxidase assembly protein subunit 15
MVSSGLSQRTEVAQDRLALHLLIAAATFGALIHTAVGTAAPRRVETPRGFATAAWVFAALVFSQLGLGALVAGLRAGLVYNTWPLMDGRWLPDGLFALGPRSLIDDVTTAQFDHRALAYLVVAFALAQAIALARAAPGTALSRRAVALAGLALAQAALGVVTLLWVVPIGLALAHQTMALLLFGMAIAHLAATRRDAMV